MGHHFTSIIVRCPRCGSEGTRSYSAVSAPSGPCVSSSFRCPACGLAKEVDYDGLPEEARAAFYAAEGRWAVSVRERDFDRAKMLDALRVLRSVRDERPGDLLHIIREGRPLVDGTLAEVEGIQSLLEAAGIPVALARKGM